jgi:hypothetical protein
MRFAISAICLLSVIAASPVFSREHGAIRAATPAAVNRPARTPDPKGTARVEAFAEEPVPFTFDKMELSTVIEIMAEITGEDFADKTPLSGRILIYRPKEDGMYVCPKHPEVTSASRGKCRKCGAKLKKAKGFRAMVEAAVSQPPPKPPPEPDETYPAPLRWELVGVTRIRGGPVAVIRDKSKRTRMGYREYIVGEGQDVPGYSGAAVTSIGLDPPFVARCNTPELGAVELRMGHRPRPTGGWWDVVRAIRMGHTYVVKLPALQERVGSAEAYGQTFGFEPNMEGTRPNGLKITSLSKDNFLYVVGLRQGDIIKTINGKPITDHTSALEKLAEAAKGFNVQIGIVRGRTSRTIFYTLLKK